MSVEEAFGYAAERTLAATALTLPGPQHPTYRFDVRGRSDVWLTAPGAHTGGRGVLSFPSGGTYLVQSGNFDGLVVAELSAAGAGGTLTVEPGRYLISERSSSVLAAGDIRRRRQRNDGGAPRRNAPGRLRTGGAQGRDRPDLRLERVRGDWRSRRSAQRPGRRSGGRLGVRLESAARWLELAVGTSRADRVNNRLDIVSYETALSLTGLHMFDLEQLSLGLGLEIGAAWLAQRFRRSRARRAATRWPACSGRCCSWRNAGHGPVFTCAQGAPPHLHVISDRTPGASPLTSYRVGAGVGLYY